MSNKALRFKAATPPATQRDINVNSEAKNISRASDDAVVPCKARIFDGRRRVGCSKRATRDGYCGTHHPDAEAKREQARNDHYAKQRRAEEYRANEQMERARRADCFDDLLAALRDVLDGLGAVHKAHELHGYGITPERADEIVAILARAEGRA